MVMRAPLLVGLFVSALMLLFGAVAGTDRAAAASCAKGSVSPRAEAAMLKLINVQRSDAGKAPVRISTGLRKVGRRSSSAMARGTTFAHDSLRWARGRGAAQNLAMAPRTRAAFVAMMGSAEHRRNLLGSRFTRIGVGAARDCSGLTYYTINLLATRR